MRILIVEDERDLGAAVQERVRLDGHAVDWFMTLEDARAAIATVDYDFMLLDLGLPDGNGRSCYVKSAARRPILPSSSPRRKIRSVIALPVCPKGRMIILSSLTT